MIKRKIQNAVPKLSVVVDLWHSYLRSLASDAGLLAKNSNYTRFILLGRSRTGSNLLRDLLNAHSQVITFGEIFRHYGTLGWDFSYFPRSGAMLSLAENDPIRFIRTRVFANFPRHITAAGFKIFYYHAHNDAWQPIWTYLSEETGLKIIHVKRKNILKTHLSRKRALETKTWVGRGDAEPAAIKPIALSYEECLEDFATTRAWEQEYDALFEKHDRLDVYYENLAANYASEMRHVQEFLGVKHEAVAPKSVQQARRPLCEAVANYSELKERFVDTPWEEFFEP